MSYKDFAKYYDILTDNVDYNHIAFYYSGILRKYSDKTGPLLDIGCGTGNLTVRMERLGFSDITGCDFSENMLASASKKSDRIKWVKCDMKALPFDGCFNICIATLDSINHLDGEESIEQAFDSVYKALSKGGIFAADMNTPYKHLNVLGNNSYTFDYDEEGLYCVWENERTEGDPFNRVNMFLDFFERQKNGLYKRSADSLFEIAPPVEKISEMLIKSGFTLLECSEYLTGEELEENSDKFIIVAEKQ